MNVSVRPNQILDSCSSTNDVLMELAREGAPQGSWISSRHQTNGRGRLGRSWVSAQGNLAFSYLLRDSNEEFLTWIPLGVGWSLVGAVDRLSLNATRIQLKWPNDLMIEEKKVGGILCERSGSSLVIGIGLNCQSVPTIPDHPVDKVGISVDSVRTEIIHCLEKDLMEYERFSVQERAELFLARSVLRAGEKIRRGSIEGIFVGLGKRGEMLVRTSDGNVRAVFN